MAIDIHAQLSDTAVSAQKIRLVVDLVRGKSAQQAINILTFMPSKGAHPLLKLLKSAVANAEKNVGIARESLYVYKITADEARTRKWRRFGARGRFKPQLKRSSHVTIVLRQLEGVQAAPAAPAARPVAKAATQKPAAKAAKVAAKPKGKTKAKASAK
jgi:large subunit ribosomal protein L22